MNTKYLIGLCLLFCLFVMACNNDVAPRLLLSKYKYDFGAVKEGTVCTGEVTVYNRGKEDLLVRNVAADCGCTKVFIDKTKIECGDSTTLHFSIDTSHKLGEVEYNAIIEANTDSAIHFVQLFADVVDDSNHE